MEIIIIAISCIALLVSVISLIMIVSVSKKCDANGQKARFDELSEKFDKTLSNTRSEINAQITNSIGVFSQSLTSQQELIFKQQHEKLESLSRTVEASMKALDSRMNDMKTAEEKNAQALRDSVKASLTEMRQGNEKALNDIKQNVDEKLQKSIEDRISRSFKEVSERLAEVYAGLGEMKTLASGVGDLKKVLSNVKTRGILGEIQLGSILSEILSNEQYEENVETVPNSGNRVEFAVKLPGEGDGTVYLPIDSKFPGDAYMALQEAYESADAEKVKLQRNVLSARIKSFAKDIKTKYIAAPYTTDFAIMFLPTEGLYAEVVQMGLIEELQRNYKINIAGPTTMAALLNSLQTGFRTLAIQKRSSEVWDILGAVKTEFTKFEDAIIDAQKKMNQASDGLEKLVGTRTKMINRKLREVSALPSEQSVKLLEETDE